MTPVEIALLAIYLVGIPVAFVYDARMPPDPYDDDRELAPLAGAVGAVVWPFWVLVIAAIFVIAWVFERVTAEGEGEPTEDVPPGGDEEI